MKKLVVVVLGCLVASTGWGAVMLEVDSGNPMRANLIADGYFAAFFVVSTKGPVSQTILNPPPIIGPPEPWPDELVDFLRSTVGEDIVSIYFVEIVPDPMHPNPPLGIAAWYEATDGRADVYLLDMNDLHIVDSVSLVPEPMSIALVGLGGLLIRRRR
jgi:hypothetical protein